MRLLKDKIVYPGPFVNTSVVELVLTDYIDRNNKTRKWEWVRRRDDKKSVAIVAIVDDGAEKKL